MGAMKGMEMGVITIAVMMFWVGAEAQSSCTSVIIGMAPCLNYITGSSSNPSSSCCQKLASVVQSQPQCLCQVLNGGGATATLGITINQTHAMELPGACNVQTPPVSACNGVNGPSTSPATESPVGSPTSSIPKESSDGSADPTTTTPESDTPSGTTGGSKKTISSTMVDASEGTRISKSQLHLAILLLFIASFATTLTSF